MASRSPTADERPPLSQQIVKLLTPYEQFIINSPLKPEAALERISEVIVKGNTTPNPYGLSDLYEGTVADYHFRMSKRPTRRDSTPPLIQGQILSGPAGSEINVSMRLDATAIPLLLWFGLVCSIFVVVLIAMIQNNDFRLDGLAPYLLLPAMGYVMIVGGFRSDVAQVRAFLLGLFESSDAP